MANATLTQYNGVFKIPRRQFLAKQSDFAI